MSSSAALASAASSELPMNAAVLVAATSTVGPITVRAPMLRPLEPNSREDLPRPLVFCGPSGVGKGTLLGYIQKEFPGRFVKTVSHTTRKPRPGEVDGVHYHFTTLEKMELDIKEGKFIESAKIHGNMYGTSADTVRAVSATGSIPILEVDIQGAENIMKMPSLRPFYFFILPPTFDDLEKRLEYRGTETKESLQRRLETSRFELVAVADCKYADACVLNKNLVDAFRDVRAALCRCYPHLASLPVIQTDRDLVVPPSPSKKVEVAAAAAAAAVPASATPAAPAAPAAAAPAASS